MCSLVFHPKAGRVAERFRVSTRLLPTLVSSEFKAIAVRDETPVSGSPHPPSLMGAWIVDD